MLIVGHDLGRLSTDLIATISDLVVSDLALKAHGCAKLDLDRSLVEPDEQFRRFFEIDELAGSLGVTQFLNFLPEENRGKFLAEFERYVGRESDMYVFAPSRSGTCAVLHFPAALGQAVVKARLYAFERNAVIAAE